MNIHHKAIRELLRSMSPNRAIEFIKAFNLPPEEERCLIDCDVKRLSYAEIMTDENKPMTDSTIKRRRYDAYNHILVDEMTTDDYLKELNQIQSSAYKHMVQAIKK